MKIPDDALKFVSKHQCKAIVYTMGDGTRITDADIAQALLDARSEIADLASTCGQCKEPVWCEVKGEVHTLRAQLAEAQAEVERLKEWTPVSERLPEKDTTEQWEMYLCKLNRYGEILTAPLAFIGGSWYSDSRTRYDEYVTGWRELPKP